MNLFMKVFALFYLYATLNREVFASGLYRIPLLKQEVLKFASSLRDWLSCDNNLAVC